jgi:hypothetical protein
VKIIFKETFVILEGLEIIINFEREMVKLKWTFMPNIVTVDPKTYFCVNL